MDDHPRGGKQLQGAALPDAVSSRGLPLPAWLILASLAVLAAALLLPQVLSRPQIASVEQRWPGELGRSATPLSTTVAPPAVVIVVAPTLTRTPRPTPTEPATQTAAPTACRPPEFSSGLVASAEHVAPDSTVTLSWAGITGAQRVYLYRVYPDGTSFLLTQGDGGSLASGRFDVAVTETTQYTLEGENCGEQIALADAIIYVDPPPPAVSAAPATPTVPIVPTVTPTPIGRVSCPPGTLILIEGDGAPPRAPYLLYFGDRVVGGDISGPDGRFRIAMAVQKEPQGDHPLAVRLRQTGQQLPIRVYTVDNTAAVKIDPSIQLICQVPAPAPRATPTTRV